MKQHPSLELLRKISLESDRLALNELLERRKLFVYGTERMLLAEFLWKMKEGYQKRLGSKRTVDEIVESVYDLTLAKFIILPLRKPASKKQEKTESPLMKHATVDCRLYYKAVLAQVDEWKQDNSDAGIIEEERAVGRILQNMMVRHFYLSIIECRRSKMPFRRRYFWKVKGKSITLWYPNWMTGREFRAWLERHIDNPNPNKLGETQKIQNEIDAYFSLHIEIPLDERWVADNRNADEFPPGITFDKTNELMLTVAQEKVRNIDKMRPAIRALGKESLYVMILRIFDDISGDRYEDNRIADEFGVSKATFSRFAGSHWSEKLGNEKADIPDLWKNTARILASDPDFMELALETGVLPKLKKVMGVIGAGNG